jgi:hypothetical protein
VENDQHLDHSEPKPRKPCAVLKVVDCFARSSIPFGDHRKPHELSTLDQKITLCARRSSMSGPDLVSAQLVHGVATGSKRLCKVEHDDR